MMQHFLSPFDLGRADCAASACAAFAERWGIDPMRDLRGRYARPRDAAALIRRAGGWVALCDDLAAQAGLRRSAHAEGALGLLRVGPVHVLAFGVAQGWVARSADGVVILPPGSEVAAWQR
jgi:hypothetical protein